MEVSDKPRAPTALSPAKELLMPIEWKARSTPGTVWMLWIAEIFLQPVHKLTTITRKSALNLVTITKATYCVQWLRDISSPLRGYTEQKPDVRKICRSSWSVSGLDTCVTVKVESWSSRSATSRVTIFTNCVACYRAHPIALKFIYCAHKFMNYARIT
jgi:hypothetical protein